MSDACSILFFKYKCLLLIDVNDALCFACNFILLFLFAIYIYKLYS